MLSWDLVAELNVQVLANTHSTEELDETLADVARLHSTQHDVQKESWKTNGPTDLQKE